MTFAANKLHNLQFTWQDFNMGYVETLFIRSGELQKKLYKQVQDLFASWLINRH